VGTLRRSHVLVAAAVAVLTLAACGGGSAKASSSTATSTTTPGGRGFLSGAFLTCLKDHGYTPPAGFGNRRRPPGGPSGASGATGTGRRRGFFGGGGLASNPKAQAAFQACRSKLPNGGRFAGGFGRGNATALRAYLSCLGDNGVKVPKTSASTPASTRRGELAQVRQDPKFAAANQICRKLLTFGGSTTTTTPA
jgi:hypothetical protein